VTTKNKKPARGRPKLANRADARNERLVVRLNKSENNTIESAAERATGSARKKSEWARAVLLSEAVGPAKTKKSAQGNDS
jgi:hypothetical protein